MVALKKYAIALSIVAHMMVQNVRMISSHMM